MAQDTEQLLKELKEILEGMKDFGQYAKDITTAMNTAIRPMQQMSDYMKAVGEQGKKSEESFAKMAESMKEMATKTQETNKLSAEEKQARIDILELRKQALELKNQDLEQEVKSKEYYRNKTEEGERSNKALAQGSSLLAEWRTNLEHGWESMVKAGYEIDKNTGKLEKQQGIMNALARGTAKTIGTTSYALTGVDDPVKGLTGMMSKLTALAPAAGMGGLIGMMIYGKMQDAEFQAVGQQASQLFDAVGGAGNKFASRMGGLARTLSVYGMAAKEDLALVAGAFAQTGVSAAQATEKVEGFTKFGGDMIVATLAADKALEVAAGTTARLAGTLAKDFNVSAKEAFINLMNYGTAAKEAGLNTMMFMQQASEAASAMRFLNANMGAVMDTQLQMSKSMKSRGFNDQYSGAYAAQGTQQVGQAVAGLGEGLAAIIGQRMGLQGSGLDVLYAMKTGSGASSRGGEQLDMTKIMKEMRSIVTEMSPNRSEQAFALTKLMGVDYAGADTILDVMDGLKGDGKLSIKAQQDLNHAFQSESQKQSQILLDIKKIQDGFARIASGLLAEVILGIKMLADAVMGGFYMLRGTLEGSKDYKDLGKAYFDLIPGLLAQTENVYQKQIVPGAKQIGEAGKDLIGQFGLDTQGMSSSQIKALKDKIDRGHAQEEDERSPHYDDTPDKQGGMKFTKKQYHDKSVPGVGRVKAEVSITVQPPGKGGKNFDQGEQH